MLQSTYNHRDYTSDKEFIPVIYVNGAINSAWRKYPLIYIGTANYNYQYDKINFIESFSNGWIFVMPINDRDKNKQYNMNVFYIKKLNYVVYIPTRYTEDMTRNNLSWRFSTKEEYPEDYKHCKCPIMVSLDIKNKFAQKFEDLVKAEQEAAKLAAIEERKSEELKRIQANKDKAVIHEYDTEIKNNFRNELKALLKKYNLSITNDELEYDDENYYVTMLKYKDVAVEELNEYFIK